MLRFFRLYWILLCKASLAQMQHRASFCMLVVAQFLSGIFEIIVPLTLCNRFKIIQGWTLKELALLYGTVHMGFALAELISRGFDKFDEIVRRGDFDRYLLRPVGPLFQVATGEMATWKIGRFLQGAFVFMWGFGQCQFSLLSFASLTLFSCFLGAIALFYGIFVMQAALAFYLKQTLELMHIISYGSRALGEYPLSIFSGVWKLFFTCFVPIGLAIFYPIDSLLHDGSSRWYLAPLCPLAGFVFLFCSIQFWKVGLRQYQSTGS